jgi:hypothetical protein
VDVGKLGITNGHQLMRRFSEIVAPSDESARNDYDTSVSNRSLLPRGQLKLPVTAIELNAGVQKAEDCPAMY